MGDPVDHMEREGNRYRRLRELITDALTEPNAVNIHEKLTAALALIPHPSGADHGR